MLKAPVVLSSRRRMLVQIAFASPAPSRSRSRTVTSSRLPVRVVPMYRRPREVDSRACSSVTGYPPRARASATSSPLGRVVGVPAMYRVMTPTAQPRASDRPTPARAIPPLSRVTTTREPITTMVRTFHGRRLMRRATVMNAMRPPRIGAVATLSGLVDPASAASSRGTPALDRAMEARVSTTTAMRSATNASNSWRRRPSQREVDGHGDGQAEGADAADDVQGEDDERRAAVRRPRRCRRRGRPPCWSRSRRPGPWRH